MCVRVCVCRMLWALCLNVSKELIVLPFVCLLIWFFLTMQRPKLRSFRMNVCNINGTETICICQQCVIHTECIMHSITHINAIWFVVHGRLYAQCIWRCGAVQTNEKAKKQKILTNLTINSGCQRIHNEAKPIWTHFVAFAARKSTELLLLSTISVSVSAMCKQTYSTYIRHVFLCFYSRCLHIAFWCCFAIVVAVAVAVATHSPPITNSCWMLNVQLNSLHNLNKKTNRFGFVWAPLNENSWCCCHLFTFFRFAHFNSVQFVYSY